MNQSIVDIYKYEGDWLDMWLQLHDGTYFHVRKDLVEKAVIVLRKHMMREIEVNHDTMLIEVDFKAGQSWGELEDLPY